jgi:hypothetical protein
MGDEHRRPPVLRTGMEALLKKLRKLAVVFVAVALAALAFPGVASADPPAWFALLPPEVQGPAEELYNQLPPEVQAAIDQAVEDALANLPPDRIDGVGNVSASPGHASASVVDIPGVITVGKSETSKTSSKVTILNVGGTDVLTKEGNETGGTNGGAAAPAGDLIDQINAATCPGGVPKFSILELFGFSTWSGTCLAVASAKATSPTPGTTTASRTKTAQFTLVHLHSDALADAPVRGVGIGYTDASSFFNQSTSTPRCRDAATSMLIRGNTDIAAGLALLLLHPGGIGSASSGGFSGVAC